MQGQQTVRPMQVRLPDDLKRWLKHRAVDGHRSTNSELIAILSAVRARENAPTAAPAGVHGEAP